MRRILGVLMIFLMGLVGLGAQEKPFIEMVKVGGGTFMMGKTEEESGVETTVSSFWMGKTEVAQAQWMAVMGTNPSKFKGDNLPVEQVSWYDAVEFCNMLSQKEGLSPAYTINKNEQDPGNKCENDEVKWTVTINPGAQGYRLPTEAEWEFAARGGNSSRGYVYSGGNSAETVGWISSNSGRKTQPVGTLGANELGLFDMTGNVYEWCWDWSFFWLGGDNPKGPSSGKLRTTRGGSFFSDSTPSMVAYPSRYYPDARFGISGFRVVRP